MNEVTKANYLWGFYIDGDETGIACNGDFQPDILQSSGKLFS